MINPEIARKLIERAKKVSQLAYAPYSQYKVGAALLTKSGPIWVACNVENVSYGLTLCAERGAVSKAISEGDNHFIAIAVASNSKKNILPCGACLQVLSEFNPGLWIITLSSTNKIIQKKVSHFLPYAFKIS